MKKIFTIFSFASLLGANVVAQITTTFNYTGTIQTYTVPAGVTSIHIDARGAQGGGSFNGAGGMGAQMTGDFAVTPGQVLSIVVGEQGLLQVGGDAQNSSGGGGGTFVYDVSGPTLYVAAGGGGGKCNYTWSDPLHPDANGQITADGGQSSDGNPGGIGGNGGNAGLWTGNPCAGGGAGWLTPGGGPFGGAGYSTWTGGPGFCGGGGGGCGGVGGFGGGGGGGNHYGGGGGGGGYSGGGGGTDPTHGGGGGSFSIGTNQVNTAGFQTGNGVVIITAPDPCSNDTVDPFFTNCPANITANTGVDSCGKVVVYSMPVAIDLCSTVMMAQTGGLASGSVFPVGTTINTFTAVDSSGNTATCSFSVTITDNQVPVATNASLDTVSGCSVTISTIPTAGDNCGTITGTTSDPLSYSTVGNYTVTWSYTDGSNTTTQTQVVTVIDCAGMEDVNGSGFSLYPNPNNGVFTLQLNEIPEGTLELQIVDAVGKKVYGNYVLAQINNYDFSYLPAGTYYIQIIKGSGKTVRTLIITH